MNFIGLFLGELGFRDGCQPFSELLDDPAKRVALPDLLTPDDVVVVSSLVERVVSNAPFDIGFTAPWYLDHLC